MRLLKAVMKRSCDEKLNEHLMAAAKASHCPLNQKTYDCYRNLTAIDSPTRCGAERSANCPTSRCRIPLTALRLATLSRGIRAEHHTAGPIVHANPPAGWDDLVHGAVKHLSNRDQTLQRQIQDPRARRTVPPFQTLIPQSRQACAIRTCF